MSPRFKAVLIGNDEFPKEPNLRPLHCPARDVRGIGALLSTEEHGVNGPYEVRELVNRPSGDVLREVHGALQGAGRDDLVLLYYSGHGKLDALGDLYLATSDTTQRDLPVSSVPVSQIKSLIKLAPVKRVVLILDCCFSGAIEKLFKGDVADQASQTIANNLDDGSGTYILTASTSIQFAEEKEGDEYSVFTQHIIHGIQDGSADRDDDGYVSVQELFEYLRKEVPRAGQQEPRGWFLNTSGRLAIAKTGKAPLEVRRNELRSRILDAAKTTFLPKHVLFVCLDVLERNPEEIWGNSETVSELLDRLSNSAELNVLIPELYRIYENRKQAPTERPPEARPPGETPAAPWPGVPSVPSIDASVPPPPSAPPQMDIDSVVSDLTESGKTELRRGNFVEAVTLFEKAIAKGGTSKPLTAFLASAREKQARSADLWAEASSSMEAKRWSAARASLEELLRLRPEDAEARLALQTVLNQVEANDVPIPGLALRFWFCNVVDSIAFMAFVMLAVYAIAMLSAGRGLTMILPAITGIVVVSLFNASLKRKNKTLGCWITRTHYDFKGTRIRFVLAGVLFNVLILFVASLPVFWAVSNFHISEGGPTTGLFLFLAGIMAASSLNNIKFRAAQQRTPFEILANVRFCADMPW